MSNIDPSILQVLSLLNTSAAGKKQAGNIGSMMDYLTDPWLGVLTGGYDPLSGVQSGASRPLMDQIASDPSAPEIVGSIARAVAEGQPEYKIRQMIRNTTDRGEFTEEELRSLASDLLQENASFQKASSTKTDMFTKAGLPAFTERYSDRPELAPLSAETRQAMGDLTSRAGNLEREYANMLATAQREAAGYKKPMSRAQAEEDVRQAEAGYKMATEKIPTKENPVANITENPFGITYGDNGVSMTPNTPKNMKKLADKALADLKKAKKILAATPKDKKAAFNKTWGDFNDPAVVSRYLQAQGKIQEANRLRAGAEGLATQAIAQGEAQGRTPLMDMLATRILASRLMGA